MKSWNHLIFVSGLIFGIEALAQTDQESGGSATKQAVSEAATAPAEPGEIEGVVRVVGPAATAEVQLDPGSGNTGPVVCASDTSKRIGKLTGYTVSVRGIWQFKKNKKQCLVPDDFAVKKASSGRPVVVGTLVQSRGLYSIDGVDGKKHPLSEIPSGLKKLDGKKVILDLKPLENLATKQESYKVVTYSAFPE